MKFAVFGDVHSNLEALEVALDTIKKEKVDKIFCVGDIVGYNSNPCECIELLIKNDVVCISGNHDRFTSGAIDAVIRAEIREIIDYTKKVLNEQQMDFIASLPDKRFWQDIFLFVHGSPRMKDEYINSLQTAKNFLKYLKQEHPFVSICFYGHTHVPYIISCKNIENKIHETTSIQLDKQFTYLINPGSVGQPRDRCPSTSFVTFDIDRYLLTYHRLEYDILATQQKINEAGFSPKIASRLEQGS